MRVLKPILLLLIFCGFALFCWRSCSLSNRVTPDGSIEVMTGGPAGAAGGRPVAEAADKKRADKKRADGGAIALILRGEKTDQPWRGRSPAAKRVCRIVPDPRMMTADPVFKAGDSVRLALFDDAVFDAEISTVTRYPNGAVGMSAPLTGNLNGTIYISYCAGQMRISVDVVGGADYYLRYNPDNGEHYAIEVDRENSVVLEGAEPLVPGAEVAQDDASPDTLSDSPLLTESSGLDDAPAESTVVDVMIVYTPAALAAAGGTSGMNNNIAMAMLMANAVHTNSDTKLYLNLVYSGEVSYEQSGDSSTDLYRLRLMSDNYMDEVHSLRDLYGADLVCLYEDEPGTGGQSFLLDSSAGRAEYAFSLVRVQQSDWTYTVVHEWGHNMGCHHSKTQTTQPGPGLYSYSAGWQWADSSGGPPYGKCTVMTYEDAYNLNEKTYTRVAYFSNPSILYPGSTYLIGDAADGDNARTIRNTRYVIADYRIPLNSVKTLPVSDDFELSFFNWVPNGGSTPWFRNTGDDLNLPAAVARGDSGTTSAYSGDWFLMFDAAQNENGTAFLDSLFDLSAYRDVSMSFRYHMECQTLSYASDLTLQISTDGAASWIDLWRGTVGTGWRELTQDLSVYAGGSNVQIRIRADIGSSWTYAYILLDDIVVSGTLNPDIDGDGLPDAWELQYFGGVTNANPDAVASNGINTVRETCIAGLDPTDSNAVFQVALSAGPVLTWSAVSGRVYSVWTATNLVENFQPLATNIFFPLSSYTDTVYQTEQFYRVDVELQ